LSGVAFSWAAAIIGTKTPAPAIELFRRKLRRVEGNSDMHLSNRFHLDMES
jgi:hypothetical protein